MSLLKAIQTRLPRKPRRLKLSPTTTPESDPTDLSLAPRSLL